MNATEGKITLDKIVKQVFGVDNPLSFEQFMNKFSFDLALPREVKDATDGSPTWTALTNPVKFMKMENARTDEGGTTGGAFATQPIADLADLLSKWEHINSITSDFTLDSLNVAESDLVMKSENVLRSHNVDSSKNVLYCDGVANSEFVVACHNSFQVTFCIRADDSVRCANSFGVSRSADLTNCIMMHDCGDMQDSMFCSNMNGRRFCIANMQFEEAEYRRLHKEVVQWVLSPQI